MTTRRKRRPAIGTRVMRPYGRVNYAEYGEIGTVTAHNDDGTFQMTLDDRQPFARSMFGSKAKPTGHSHVHKVLNAYEVEVLSKVYRGTAKRLRLVAKDYDLAAREQDEIQKKLREAAS